MKLIGFIKEHDDVEESLNLSQLSDFNAVDTTMLYDLVKYLERGKTLHESLSFFRDKETLQVIEEKKYLTDGEFVWPSYLVYYLEKYKTNFLDQEFLDYLEQKKFKRDLIVWVKGSMESEFLSLIKG